MTPELFTHEELLLHYKNLQSEFDNLSSQMARLLERQKEYDDHQQLAGEMIGVLGIGGNVSPLMKLFEHTANESDYNKGIEYLVKMTMDHVQITEFVRYYNSHHTPKIDEEKVNVYLDRLVNPTEENNKEYVSEYLSWQSRQSDLRWVGDEKVLKQLYEILMGKKILKISEAAFRLHFQGYYNRSPKLNFKDFTLVDIIYLFQELELAGYIEPFMGFYASNLSLHTEYSQQRFQEAKSKNVGSKIEYKSGKLIKAITKTKKSHIIDDILNHL